MSPPLCIYLKCRDLWPRQSRGRLAHARKSDPLASTSLDYWVDQQSFIDDVIPLLERSEVFDAGGERILRERYGLPSL